MKNTTIRWIFALAIFAAAGIIVTQVYWVQRAYALADKEFNLKVNTALRDVALKIWELKRSQAPLYNVVDQVSPDYFIVKLSDRVDASVIEHFLKQQFEQQQIITDFEFGFYDCQHDSVMSKHYVHMSGSNEPFEPVMEFPNLSRDNYYFGIAFPHRKKYVASQLTIWIVSSVALLGVMTFMGYIVVAIFKQKRLREVQKDFVNNMTHEFKTPLATIQISAEVLKKPEIINNPQRLLNYATIIDNEASQLAMQVERVLQMAHAEKGEIQLKNQPLIWQQIIKEVSSKFEGILKRNNAQLILDMPEQPVHYNGDELHLKNVISNLLDNALKYSRSNPIIEIKLSEKEKQINISVRDNGDGIEEEHQKMIFNQFYRVPKGNIHNVKGFGLGLNYVSIISKAHGGRVFCNSKLGNGSTFTIQLPKK